MEKTGTTSATAISTKKLKHNAECICNENGIEILVGYSYEKSAPQVEEGHGLHDVGSLTLTELESVEVVVAGRGIDILSLLHENEKEWIISKLKYE